MARLYSNENIARQVVEELRRLGHDVLTSAEAGNANSAIPDHEVLKFAADNGRILLTHNRRHFLRLHRERVHEHAGIVACTVDPDFAHQAKRIDKTLSESLAEDIRNGFFRVNRPA